MRYKWRKRKRRLEEIGSTVYKVLYIVLWPVYTYAYVAMWYMIFVTEEWKFWEWLA